MEIISKTGKRISIEINADGSSIVASAIGTDISFMADQTETGFKSRFPEYVGGKRTYIEVVVSGDDLERVRALFAELADRVKARGDFEREYDAHRQGVLSMLNK